MSACTVMSSPLEDYLQNTPETFDTVYIDTWDSIYHEYLPYLNKLGSLAARIIRPGGEILLWAYDMMVRQFLKTAELIWKRRQAYCAADPAQIENFRQTYPLLHKLAAWLRSHPQCSDEEFRSTAYELATWEHNTMEILKLASLKGGAVSLLQSGMKLHCQK